MTLKRQKIGDSESELLTFALAFPEAWQDSPWGHVAVKVRKKAFIFMGTDDEDVELSITVKLPVSGEIALTLPFAKPTGYGLGKSGWVSAQFMKGDKPPLDLMRSWIDESYRAIAPKTLAKTLPETVSWTGTMKAKKKKATKKKATKKKATKKKATKKKATAKKKQT